MEKAILDLAHTPVMVNEILTAFAPLRDRADLRYFDGTLGRGGHALAILKEFNGLRMVGMDRDPDALAESRARFEAEGVSSRVELVHGNFSEFASKNLGSFDLMLIDLGVSSPQLDRGNRGFSFYLDGPLDMRMDPTKGATAADLVNEADEEELLRIFRDLGEVHRPMRVIHEIVHRRRQKAFTTTGQLSSLIESVDGWRKKGFHPATNYFLGLRLHVNQELESLDEGLHQLKSGLKPGGRLAVLTFHSLEDRIVKYDFRDSEELGKPVNKKVIVPERDEILKNVRSRSAKLRIFERRQ